MPWSHLPGCGPHRHRGVAVPSAAVPRSGTPLPNLFTTTTSPPRSLWPQRHPRLPVTTTSPATGCCRCPTSVPLGARPVPVPRLAVSAASESLPAFRSFLCAGVAYHVSSTSVVMDTTKAKSVLGWTPNTPPPRPLSGLASRCSYCV